VVGLYQEDKEGTGERRIGIGLVCDQEIMAGFLGHGEDLILILGEMESCRKVLVRINVIGFIDFVVTALNPIGS